MAAQQHLQSKLAPLLEKSLQQLGVVACQVIPN